MPQERENDVLATKAKESLIAEHKKARAQVYRQRYASPANADEFYQSELKDLYRGPPVGTKAASRDALGGGLV